MCLALTDEKYVFQHRNAGRHYCEQVTELCSVEFAHMLTQSLSSISATMAYQ